jgi:DNA-binding MarR family transcriptional regulator
VSWELIFVSVFGVVFIVSLLTLAIRFPHPTNFQLLVFRTVLALAAAGIAASVPGFLNLSLDLTGVAVRAGGALAVFLLIYRLNPAETVVQDQSVAPERPDGEQRSLSVQIETLEQLAETVSNLSGNQKTLLDGIVGHPEGIHVSDLTLKLQLSRSDIVYRARDLQRDGLIKIRHLTDMRLELSEGLKKLAAIQPAAVNALLRKMP